MTPLLHAPIPLRKVAVRNAATGVLGLAAAVLYFLSFFVPAHYECPGFLACISSVVFVVGLPMAAANPLFLVGLDRLFQGEYRSARHKGVVALLLALSESWLFWDGLRVGYFMWVGSMGLLVAASWYGGYNQEPAYSSRGGGEASRIAARFSAINCYGPRSLPSDRIAELAP